MATPRRYGAVFATDERNRGQGRSNIVYFYLDASLEGEEAESTALAVSQGIGDLINAKLVSVNAQIYSADYTNLPEGFANGGGYTVKALFKNDTTEYIQQLSWVFGRGDQGDDEIGVALNALFTAQNVLNKHGDPIGPMLRATRTVLSQS